LTETTAVVEDLLESHLHDGVEGQQEAIYCCSPAEKIS
jgi:hypothetical protein